MKKLGVLLFFCGLTAGTGNIRAGEADASQGLKIAQKHCSRCHIVDESNRFSGISSTPSFKTLVTALADWRNRFETFYVRNPHPSVISVTGVSPKAREAPSIAAVELTLEDVTSLVAYAEKYAIAEGKKN